MGKQAFLQLSPCPGVFGKVCKYFSLSTLDGRKGVHATGIQLVDANDPAKRPTMHGTATCNRELSGPKYQQYQY